MPDQVDVHRGNESFAAMAGNNVQELEVSHNGGLYHGRVKPVVKLLQILLAKESCLYMPLIRSRDRQKFCCAAERWDLAPLFSCAGREFSVGTSAMRGLLYWLEKFFQEELCVLMVSLLVSSSKYVLISIKVLDKYCKSARASQVIDSLQISQITVAFFLIYRL